MKDPEPQPPLTVGRVLGRALTLKCTVCGGGGVFRGPFKMVEQCPTCGFRFQRVHGHWIGAIGINTIVSFGALLAVTVVGFIVTYPDTPVMTLVLIATGVSAVFPLIFFPWSRMLWSAVDLLMRPLDPDDEVDPRWWPSAKPPSR